MSHECPCCGQWVRGESPLPPEQEQSIKDYVDHLADKANARKSALQSRVAEMEEQNRKMRETLDNCISTLYGLADRNTAYSQLLEKCIAARKEPK